MAIFLNSHPLQSIVVELSAMESGHPPATLGRAIHAQILKWIQLGDPQLSERIHAGQSSPLSVSGLMGNRRQPKTQAGDRFYFRIGIIDGTIIQPLLTGIERWETQEIVLGKFPFVATKFSMFRDSHSLAESSSYESLAQSPIIKPTIQLMFHSPTSFKQKDKIQTFLLPELVFSSLHRRWNQFAPEALHFSEVEWEGLVSAYELKTHALRLEGGGEIGAQGWIRYRFPDEEQAQIASILARFAFFSGVGRKTTMGMGQAKVQLPKPHK
ncbi:CRISPR-associated endoribonuclease Cas6 [Lyngbya sp. CCY1209]|uniref:CRISPR-associated endoribonuclease Cas6 n=1 Tax=Lyngbya sp. CCY1209 TaxID=2886103 RepID=UPI002D211D7F|nr:CRISPR-associated endoribonuclease Cas6 [Lyngbya sp. CCY1209]MEB3887056.1 CRISPR-associated endoribonuclease Cas6 [Lyngbya sp. CCY1209]